MSFSYDLAPESPPDLDLAELAEESLPALGAVDAVAHSPVYSLGDSSASSNYGRGAAGSRSVGEPNSVDASFFDRFAAEGLEEDRSAAFDAAGRQDSYMASPLVEDRRPAGGQLGKSRVSYEDSAQRDGRQADARGTRSAVGRGATRSSAQPFSPLLDGSAQTVHGTEVDEYDYDLLPSASSGAYSASRATNGRPLAPLSSSAAAADREAEKSSINDASAIARRVESEIFADDMLEVLTSTFRIRPQQQQQQQQRGRHGASPSTADASRGQPVRGQVPWSVPPGRRTVADGATAARSAPTPNSRRLPEPAARRTSEFDDDMNDMFADTLGIAPSPSSPTARGGLRNGTSPSDSSSRDGRFSPELVAIHTSGVNLRGTRGQTGGAGERTGACFPASPAQQQQQQNTAAYPGVYARSDTGSSSTLVSTADVTPSTQPYARRRWSDPTSDRGQKWLSHGSANTSPSTAANGKTGTNISPPPRSPQSSLGSVFTRTRTSNSVPASGTAAAASARTGALRHSRSADASLATDSSSSNSISLPSTAARRPNSEPPMYFTDDVADDAPARQGKKLPPLVVPSSSAAAASTVPSAGAAAAAAAGKGRTAALAGRTPTKSALSTAHDHVKEPNGVVGSFPAQPHASAPPRLAALRSGAAPSSGSASSIPQDNSPTAGSADDADTSVSSGLLDGSVNRLGHTASGRLVRPQRGATARSTRQTNGALPGDGLPNSTLHVSSMPPPTAYTTPRRTGRSGSSSDSNSSVPASPSASSTSASPSPTRNGKSSEPSPSPATITGPPPPRKISTLPAISTHRPTSQADSAAGASVPSLAGATLLPLPATKGILERRPVYTRPRAASTAGKGGSGSFTVRRKFRRRRSLPFGQRRANWTPPVTNYQTCLSMPWSDDEDDDDGADAAAPPAGNVSSGNRGNAQNGSPLHLPAGPPSAPSPVTAINLAAAKAVPAADDWARSPPSGSTTPMLANNSFNTAFPADDGEANGIVVDELEKLRRQRRQGDGGGSQSQSPDDSLLRGVHGKTSASSTPIAPLRLSGSAQENIRTSPFSFVQIGRNAPPSADGDTRGGGGLANGRVTPNTTHGSSRSRTPTQNGGASFNSTSYSAMLRTPIRGGSDSVNSTNSANTAGIVTFAPETIFYVESYGDPTGEPMEHEAPEDDEEIHVDA